MNILGISCFYHDSAACLVRDGEIIAAAQEERFTRKKHDLRFPKNAISFCLNYDHLNIDDIKVIAFYDKPFIKFERILETYLAYAPKGIHSFLMAMPLWIKQKLWIPDYIRKELNYNGRIVFTEHHESHAASAFFPSPFQHAAFLTMDGVGEWTTTSFGTGHDNKISIDSELHFPHSLGLLYSAFTYYTGFKVNSGEYKLMGLAPYGEPVYVEKILDNLIDLKPDGSFKLNMKYFNYCSGLTMTSRKFHDLFGAPPRKPESTLRKLDMDVARSIQKVTEMVMLRSANHVFRKTGERNLCLAGGVALNCVANGRIIRETPFENVWIQPASGDAGGALGAALFTWYQIEGNARQADGQKDTQKLSLLGPEYSHETIKHFLSAQNAVYTELTDDQLYEKISSLISEGSVVGWFQGRMEFGPRALGSRSILGDARNQSMQSRINFKIKFRESFRPFAPSVLQEKTLNYFNTDQSPYMLVVTNVNSDHLYPLSETDRQKQGIDKLKVKRSDIPAVTHVDNTARIQSVSKEHSRYYNLLKTFYQKTGCPVIINTSFNVRGEPIVCSPHDAFACFMNTDMDYLVMGNFLLNKKEQQNGKKKWRETHELNQ